MSQDGIHLYLYLLLLLLRLGLFLTRPNSTDSSIVQLIQTNQVAFLPIQFINLISYFFLNQSNQLGKKSEKNRQKMLDWQRDPRVALYVDVETIR